jgi:threonine dehydratase
VWPNKAIHLTEKPCFQLVSISGLSEIFWKFNVLCSKAFRQVIASDYMYIKLRRKMNHITIEDIVRAKERITPFVHATPILTSSILNKWLKHEIFFKAENFQKIGAFKARGACNTVAWLAETNQKPKHIVTNSSGNHAQAVAWAARRFGIPATIYMPYNASKIKIQATIAYQAKVVLCKSRAEADEKVIQASREKGTYWIPPFNHEQVIAGQGTAVYESLKELEKIDAVFAPCGGGGLLSGSYIAARALAPEAEVIGAEPLNANDAVQSRKMGFIQRLPGTPNSIADGVLTLSVGDITFEYLKNVDDIYEVEEQRIIYWTQWLNHLLKVSVEPTSAMTMDAVCRWLSGQRGKKKVLVILSGGNTDQLTMKKIWEKNFLSEIPKLKEK